MTSLDRATTTSIMVDWRAGISTPAIARRHDISESTVRAVAREQGWTCGPLRHREYENPATTSSTPWVPGAAPRARQAAREARFRENYPVLISA